MRKLLVALVAVVVCLSMVASPASGAPASGAPALAASAARASVSQAPVGAPEIEPASPGPRLPGEAVAERFHPGVDSPVQAGEPGKYAAYGQWLLSRGFRPEMDPELAELLGLTEAARVGAPAVAQRLAAAQSLAVTPRPGAAPLEVAPKVDLEAMPSSVRTEATAATSPAGAALLEGEGTGSIMGMVFGPDGGPGVQGIAVTAYMMVGEGEWVEALTTNTAEDGAFTLTLAPGLYWLGFSDPLLAYVDEFYDDSGSLSEAMPLSVAENTVTGGIYATLRAYQAHIQGRVTDTQGAPLDRVRVDAYYQEDWGSSLAGGTYTDADGYYQLPLEWAGTLYVQFYPTMGEYLFEYYDNMRSWVEATLVAVEAGTTASGIDAQLAHVSEKGRIQGKVTGPDGVTPLEGFGAAAFSWSEPDQCWCTCGAATLTNAEGDYDLVGLEPGTYRLEFADPTGAHLTEYYADASQIDLATDLVISEGSLLWTGIDASLALAPPPPVDGHLVGTVTGPSGTPLAGIDVTVYQDLGGWYPWAGHGATDDNGYWDVSLPEGAYRVGFGDPSGAYVSEFYSDAPNLDSATSLYVGAGATVTADAQLATSGRITGRVVAANGVGIAGIQVGAYPAEEWWWGPARRATTDESGYYEIIGLAEGSYRLGYEDPSGGFMARYYPDATDIWFAEYVAVTPGQATPVLDVTLPAAGRILGAVTNRAAVPLGGIEVTVYRVQCGEYLWSSWGYATEADGSYVIGGLAAGNYLVEFRDPAGDYATQYLGGLPTRRGSSYALVLEGGDAVNVNATLGPAARISGAVGGAIGPAYWMAINVDYLLGDEPVSVATISTDELGLYSVGGLAPGTYRLWVYTFGGDGPYPNGPAAEDVVVSEGETRDNVTITLAVGGSITGRVVDADTRLPIEGVNVHGSIPGFPRYTDDAGLFTITGLAAGSYDLIFYTLNLGWPYSDVNVHDVAVTAGQTTLLGDVAMPRNKEIRGSVVDPQGTPLGGASVVAYGLDGADWQWASEGPSQDDGSFALGVPEGVYRLRVWGGSGGVFAYNGGALDFASAPDIVVGAGDASVNAGTVTIPQGSQIEGTVTGPGGVPLGCLYLDVLAPWSTTAWREVTGSIVDEAGHYRVGGLGPGTYRLLVRDASGTFPPTYWDGVATIGEATEVVIPAPGGSALSINPVVGATGTAEGITPPAGGSVTTSDGALTLAAPAGIGPQITIFYTPLAAPAPGSFEGAGLAFQLNAYDWAGQPLTTLDPPLWLTLHYDDAALPVGPDEATLAVRRYDPVSGWVALQVMARDTDANTITVLLNHFSLYSPWYTFGNPDPTLTLGALSAPADPLALGTPVQASAGYTGSAEVTATWDWGDDTTSPGTATDGVVTGSHVYTTPGVYTVGLTVTDASGLSAQASFRYVVVYDANGGFVTGGGWITSPEGACPRCPESPEGQANFGFVSRYKKGAYAPTGQTEFQFKAGGLDFHSTSYDWLVVAGANAKYKGDGAIKGLEGAFKFMLTATDGDLLGGEPDAFRIRIWDDTGLYYDNQADLGDDDYGGTEPGGGNIVVHNGK